MNDNQPGPLDVSIDDLLTRYNTEIARLTQRALAAEAQRDRLAAALAQTEEAADEPA